MNKGFIKTGVLFFAVVLAFLVGLVGFTNKTGTASATYGENACTKECPTVEWTLKYCPLGSIEHGDKCKKKVDGQWTYVDKIVGKTFSVKYEKSNDYHKCHRPSVNELKEKYGMNVFEALAFTKDNPEHKDKVRVCVTPTPTGEVTPTPTPTGEVTPTPTVEPTPTTTPTSDGQSDGKSSNPDATKAPVCPDGKTVSVPANPHVWRNGASATVNFFITEGDSADVVYKEVNASDWQHAVANLKPNADKFVSVDINGLDPELGYTFGVRQRTGCGGGETITAVIVDGPEPTLFQFSYWEVK